MKQKFSTMQSIANSITFHGDCLTGKDKGQTIVGFGFKRIRNKVYVYGSREDENGHWTKDAWHRIDLDSLCIVIANF